MSSEPRAYGFIALRRDLAAAGMKDMERSAIYARIEALDSDVRYLFWFSCINFVLIIGTLVVTAWLK